MGETNKTASSAVFGNQGLPDLATAMDTSRANAPYVYPESETGKLVLTTRQPVAESPRGAIGLPVDEDIIKRGTTLGAYYINPPLPDEYVFRKLAFKLKNAIRAHNMDKGQNFFEVYPEALLSTGSSSITDFDEPVNIIITHVRDYLLAMMNYVATMATTSVFMNLQNVSVAKRLAFKFKYKTVANNHAQYFNGMPFNREIYDYIVRHTRILTSKDYIGGNVVVLPLWASDLRGLRGMHYLSAEAKKFAGIMPYNTQIDADAATYHSFIYETTAWSAMDEASGYLGTAHNELMNAWRDYLGGSSDYKTHYKMKDPDYAIRRIMEALGVFDMTMDFSQLVADVKANAPGDLNDFATKHMTLGSQICGTYGQRDRDWRLHFTGMSATDFDNKQGAIPWVGSDDQFIAAWYKAPGVLGGEDLTSAYWLDYYSRYRNTDSKVLRRVSIENTDLIGSDAYMDDDELLGWGYYAKFMQAGDDGVALYGVTKSFAQQFFVPNAEGTPEVFVVPAEMEDSSAGITIHQMHMPLIDTEDPYQCGFYVILSDEDGGMNSWNKFFASNERVPWDTDAAGTVKAKDVIVYVGDAITLHPNTHFHRDYLSNMVYRESDTNNGEGGFLAALMTLLGGGLATGPRLGWSHPFKPFTVNLPLDVSFGSNPLVMKSKKADLSDMGWSVIGTETAWQDIVYTADDADVVPVYNFKDGIPFDVVAKWMWLWFRRGIARYDGAAFGLKNVGYLTWLSTLPRIVATNWFTDRRAFFDKYVNSQDEVSIDLSSITYENGPVDLTGPGSPIVLTLDKFQRKDGGKESNGKSNSRSKSRGKRSSNNRRRSRNSKVPGKFSNTYDKSEAEERFPEGDNPVKGQSAEVEMSVTDPDMPKSETSRKKKKKEEESV